MSLSRMGYITRNIGYGARGFKDSAADAVSLKNSPILAVAFSSILVNCRFESRDASPSSPERAVHCLLVHWFRVVRHSLLLAL